MEEEQPKYFQDFLATFKCHDLFPSDSNYKLLLKILKVEKGNQIAGIARHRKREVQKKFKCDVNPGGKEVLVAQKSGKKILKQREFFKAVKKAHDQSGHPGRDITYKKMMEFYDYVPSHLINLYVKNCNSCKSRRLTSTRVGMQVRGPMDRIQIDFIDMSSNPADGYVEFQWILQVRDISSMFTWAFPLRRKTCAEIIVHIREIFYMFGPPKVLQYDNGGEIGSSELKRLINLEFPVVKVVDPSSRLSQTNDFKERELLEHTVEAHIKNHKEWVENLPKLVYEINTSYSSTIESTPFQTFFGRPPNNSVEIELDRSKEMLNKEEQLCFPELDVKPEVL